MAAPFTTPALLLRSVDYKDSDKIVTLLTLAKGKLSALARGARKSQKRFGGALEPFAVIEVTLGKGRTGRLWNIEEAEVQDTNAGISQNLERVSAASYIIEFIRETMPESLQDEALFYLATKVFSTIAATDSLPLAKVVISAEIKFCTLLGMAVGIKVCNGCGRPVPKGRSAHFHPGRGGVVCTECGGGPLILKSAEMALFDTLSKATVSQSAGIPADQEHIFGIETALDNFIDYHLERPLPTRKFYRTTRKLGNET